MILRLAFNKKSYIKYIGHLDLVKIFKRTINKKEIDVKYSQGFNPQPRLSIANPLSLGVESEEEYMDIELNREIPVAEFISRMNQGLPRGIEILRGKYIDTNVSVDSMIAWAYYEISFRTNSDIEEDQMMEKIADYMAREEIYILKKRKKKRRKIEVEIDIRGWIANIKLRSVEGDKLILEALLKSGGNGNLKPLEFVDSLSTEEDIDIDMDSVNIKRLALYAEENGEIYKPV